MQSAVVEPLWVLVALCVCGEFLQIAEAAELCGHRRYLLVTDISLTTILQKSLKLVQEDLECFLFSPFVEIRRIINS